MTLLSGVVSLFSNNFTDNIRVVPDNVTVQQVIDSITDASLTNKYLIVIPSGHETETFSYKPGLEFYFLDGTGRKPIIEKMGSWEDVSYWDWIGGSTCTTIEERGRSILQVVQNTDQLSYLQKQHLDLRKWQGLLVEFETDISSSQTQFYTRIRIHPHNDNGDLNLGYLENSWILYKPAGETTADVRSIFFCNFGQDRNSGDNLTVSEIDWSDVALTISFISYESGTTIKIKNICLVRTLPYPAIFIRCDDVGTLNTKQLESYHEFNERGVIPAWCVTTNYIPPFSEDNGNSITHYEMQALEKNGICHICNHSDSHPHFDTLTSLETLYEITSSLTFFERVGFENATRFFANPYTSNNTELLKLLRDYGLISLYPQYGNFPTSLVRYVSEFQDKNEWLSGKGGIGQLLYHGTDVVTDSDLSSFLSSVDSLLQTHFPVSVVDAAKMCFTPKTKLDNLESSLHDTLSDNVTLYVKTANCFFDANGSDRNITPHTYGFRSGDKRLIVNTGSSGNLIFDPSGLNLSITPGNSATVLYDGSNWRQI